MKTGPVEYIIADQSDSILGDQWVITQSTVRAVITILKPLEVGLHYTLVVVGDQAMLTNIHPMFKAEQVGHLPLRTLAQTHGLSVVLLRNISPRCFFV